MNFNEAVGYLYNLGHETLAMKLGLETVRTLAIACGDPQRKFPAVHIAGTNGKGSTAAMTGAILRAAGYDTGLYTSPHLVSITERIRVNGRRITEDDSARLAGEVRATSERLVAGGSLAAPPTFFEQVTMIAFLYFAECRVDLAVLEVGMGGRLDATNICEPLVTAITPVGYDHQKHLGNTLAEIAGEKAGIIKPAIPVVVAPQEGEAMGVIVNRADELAAPLILVEEVGQVSKPSDDTDLSQIGRYGFRYRTDRSEYEIRLGLRGRHQVTNALTAICIAEQLIEKGWTIPDAAIVEGLSRVEWPGRLELIQTMPGSAPLLLDGAHNIAGAIALRDFLLDHFSSRPITLIFGAMADKAIEEMGAVLFPLAGKLIATKVNNPRAAGAEKIAEIARAYCPFVVCAEDAGEALDEALRITAREGLICVCGSLFLVGEIREENAKHAK